MCRWSRWTPPRGGVVAASQPQPRDVRTSPSGLACGWSATAAASARRRSCPSRSARRPGSPTTRDVASDERVRSWVAALRRGRGADVVACLGAGSLQDRGLTGRLTKAEGDAAQHGHVGDLWRQPLLQPLSRNPRPEIVVDTGTNAVGPPLSRRDTWCAGPAGAAETLLGPGGWLLLARHSANAILRSTSGKGAASAIEGTQHEH
jgi:hypothetical protein